MDDHAPEGFHDILRRTHSVHATRPWHRRRLRRPGLTLIEVVAGLALLATVLVLVFAARDRVAHQQVRADRRLAAVAAADALVADWLRDQGVSLLVTWVFSSIIVLLVVGFARWRPRTWPLWVGVVAAVLTVIGSWVYPLAYLKPQL